MKDSCGIKGMFRINIVDHKTGRVEGDSGWCKNTTTNNGLNAIAALSVGAAGSYQAGYLAIGEGTDVIATDATDLSSRENSFQALTPSTVATGTARATCSFAGADNSDTLTIGEIGMFKTNTAGSLIAGQTYTTSEMTTDQDVNATYELHFASTT